MSADARSSGERLPFWRSLRAKYSLTYVLVIAAVVILLNVYPAPAARDMVFLSKQAALWNQAQTLSGALTTLGSSLTEDGVTQVVDRIGTGGVTRLMVTDPAGRVLYDSAEEAPLNGRYALLNEVVSALGGNRYIRCEFKEGAFLIRAAVPVFYRSGVIGTVYLYERDAEQGALLLGIQKNLRTISIVIAAAALLLTLVFSRALTARIGQLLRAIRVVREGEYSHRIALSGGDELTRLANEFDELTTRLQSTEEIRRRFVSDASHELKTPLASIRLLTDSILQSDHMDPDTARDFLTDIGDEAERLSRITEDLLRLTRIDNAQSPDAVCVDPAEAVQRAFTILTPLADASDVRLEAFLEPACTVLASADALHQIVFNLTENAIKYNLPGGEVCVRLFRREDSVLLQVEDTGVGIPEEDLPRIFERFYRVDKARSRAAGGTGLGLAIVRDTVELYGGTVTVRRREGVEGTVFEVCFPYAPGEVTA